MLFYVSVVIWIIINVWEQYWQPGGHDDQFFKFSRRHGWLTYSRLWRSILEWVRSLIDQRCRRGCCFALWQELFSDTSFPKKIRTSSVNVKKPPAINYQNQCHGCIWAYHWRNRQISKPVNFSLPIGYVIDWQTDMMNEFHHSIC